SERVATREPWRSIQMLRSRALGIAAGLAATLGLTTVAVLSNPLHDEEAQEAVRAPDGPGPDESRPVVMPPGLAGLEVALGLKDTMPTAWEGDVRVSEGRVLSVEVVRSAPEAGVEGAHFSVGTAKAAAKNKKQQAKKEQAKKKQQAAVPPVLRVN